MEPVEQLILEHRNILRGVNLLQRTKHYFEKDEILEDEINQLLHFFKEYADTGHHAKEEELLFKVLIEKKPGLSSEFSPLGVLTSQHVEGRALISKLSKLEDQFPFYVNDYSTLLERHIEMEDELFPEMVASNLNQLEILQLSNDFSQAEEEIDTNSLLQILDRIEISL